MAEWPIASVLKTEVPKGSVGSNPTSSDSLSSVIAGDLFKLDDSIKSRSLAQEAFYPR